MKHDAVRILLPPAVATLLPVLTLIAFPGAAMVSVLVTFWAGAAVVSLALRHCPWRSYGAYIWLVAALALLTSGAIVNVNFFTIVSGGYLDRPVLLQTDARRLWYYAGQFLNTGYTQDNSQSILTSLLFMVGVRDIFIAIMLNVIFAVLAMTVTGQIAWRMSCRRDVALWAMCGLSLMCYFMAQATILIKDVPLTLGMALSALALLCFRDRRYGAGTWALAGGLLLTALYRSPMLLFIPLGAAVMAVVLRDWRRMAVPAVAALAVWGAVALAGSLGHTMKIIDDSAGVYFLTAKAGETAAGALVGGGYPSLPLWRKILMLPATAIMQFLIPFPWTWAKHLSLAPTTCVAHMGFTWYLAGGVFIYWLFGLLRRSPRTMACIGLWAVMLYLLIAFQFGGRVSRYCLPLLPLMMPAVAYTLLTAWRRRSFRIWMGAFVLMMAAVLTVCHYLSPAV